jgi:outer membrane protein OmpA-like peptidoglycan-associated protein
VVSVGYRLQLSAALAIPMALSTSAAVQAQQIERGVAIVSEAIASRVDGFGYNPGSTSDLKFRGSALSQLAEGTARVRIGDEVTEISARFEHLPQPASFGPFTVYVLWVVTPEGRAYNIGAINVDGDKGKVAATTPFSSFALIVTAEPHFAVSVPSKYIVLQNVAGKVQGTQLVVTSLEARSDYKGLKPLIADPKRKEPLELAMARYAITIAEAAGAGELAPKALDVARAALKEAEAAQNAKSSSARSQVPAVAREAVQAAEDARAVAETRRAGADVERMNRQISERDAKLVELQGQLEKAKQAAASQTAEISAANAQLKNVQQRMPSAGNRLQLANELLGRWLVLDAGESSLTAHVQSDAFVKGKTELLPATHDRLGTAAGILVGIGSVTVTVTPALQLSEDVRQLGLSQQRARSLMEWLASLGLKVNAGVPSDSSGAVEKAVAPGPGVDLLIIFDGPSAVGDAAKT